MRAQPGQALGACIVAGTVVAALAVRPSTGRLIFPVPVLSYLIAAFIAGIAYNRSSSKTELIIGATQWIADGFFLMALATVLAILLITARWLIGRRGGRGSAATDWSGPGDGTSRRPQPAQDEFGTAAPGEARGARGARGDGQSPRDRGRSGGGRPPRDDTDQRNGPYPGPRHGQHPGPYPEPSPGQRNKPYPGQPPGPRYGQYPDRRTGRDPDQSPGQRNGADVNQVSGPGYGQYPEHHYGQYPEHRNGTYPGQRNGRAAGQDPAPRYEPYPDQRDRP